MEGEEADGHALPKSISLPVHTAIFKNNDWKKSELVETGWKVYGTIREKAYQPLCG